MALAAGMRTVTRLVQRDADRLTDVDPWIMNIARDVYPKYTMTSLERVCALCSAVAYVIRHGIEGAIVECGVWRGGSMMAIAKTLSVLGDTSRHLWLFDTFRGMPQPSDADVDHRGTMADAYLRKDPNGRKGRNPTSDLNEVTRNMDRTKYPSANIHYIEGKVEDTIPGQLPDRVALARLDTDWYESTRHELENIVPRVSSHGVVIIDDYGHWAGCRKATDEFFAAFERPVLLSRVDYTGRMAVIPGPTEDTQSRLT